MKKKIIMAVGLVIVASAASTVILSNSKKSDLSFFERNVEALSDTESSKNDGALWSNSAGDRYCCGPGNVRDCNEIDIPRCQF